MLKRRAKKVNDNIYKGLPDKKFRKIKILPTYISTPLCIEPTDWWGNKHREVCTYLSLAHNERGSII